MQYFRTFVHGRILIIRWLEPTADGARALSQLIEQTHARVGERLFFAGIVSAKCPAPAGEDRWALTREHERISELLLTSRTVVLGRSFRQSFMRSVLASILMVATRQGRGFVTDGSVTELTAAAQQFVGVEPRWLVDQLLAAGVLQTDELDGRPKAK
jgi:hypothetical protein